MINALILLVLSVELFFFARKLNKSAKVKSDFLYTRLFFVLSGIAHFFAITLFTIEVLP